MQSKIMHTIEERGPMLYLVTGYYPAQGYQENFRVKISSVNHNPLPKPPFTHHIFRPLWSKIPFLCIWGKFSWSFHIYSRSYHTMNPPPEQMLGDRVVPPQKSSYFQLFHRKREIRTVNLHVGINNQWVISGYCSSPRREQLWRAGLLLQGLADTHLTGTRAQQDPLQLGRIQGSWLEHILQRREKYKSKLSADRNDKYFRD